MKALFEIGQRVVCVDSSCKDNLGDYAPDGKKFDDLGLIEGKEYTVRGINKCTCGAVSIAVFKCELNSSWCHCGNHFTSNEAWFLQIRFVPLDFDCQADEEIKESLNKHLLIEK